MDIRGKQGETNVAKWKLVNAENVKPFVCDDVYSSKMLTGNEMAGQPVININEGTLKPGGTTMGDGRGGVHEETEIYYIIEGEGFVVLDDVPVPVKAEDIIVIPGGVYHWIDNRNSDKPFRLFTFWPKQEQNGVYFERLKTWGTSVRNVDDNYTEKRLKQKK
jgi:mannose-6-phosphate isomerase-like protein (cupin superfamily)